MDTDATPEAEGRSLVGSVVQAISILRHLGTIERGEGVTAIARQLGLNPSSCFNVLKTLVVEDLVSFDTASKTYSLGLGTVDLARLALGREPALDAAKPGMDMLAERFDAAVGLWRVTGRERLTLLMLSESESTTRIHMVVGQRQPATAGAGGRAVLAARGVSDAAISQAFAKVRWQQAPEEADFIRQVHEARGRGWALDVDQINRGVTTVATALADEQGLVRFCLSASMFTGRDPQERIEELGQAMCQVARRLGETIYGKRRA